MAKPPSPCPTRWGMEKGLSPPIKFKKRLLKNNNIFFKVSTVLNLNTVDTFKKYVSVALESETDVNSWLSQIVGVIWHKPVHTYAIIVWMNFGGFDDFGELVHFASLFLALDYITVKLLTD